MIFCSHVIEHQRNQGAFLDKIYDILKDEGDLNFEAEKFVEGLNNNFTSLFADINICWF